MNGTITKSIKIEESTLLQVHSDKQSKKVVMMRSENLWKGYFRRNDYRSITNRIRERSVTE